MSFRGSPEVMGMSAMRREVTGRRAAGSGRSRNWSVHVRMSSMIPLVALVAGAASSFCQTFSCNISRKEGKQRSTTYLTLYLCISITLSHNHIQPCLFSLPFIHPPGTSRRHITNKLQVIQIPTRLPLQSLQLRVLHPLKRTHMR